MQQSPQTQTRDVVITQSTSQIAEPPHISKIKPHFKENILLCDPLSVPHILASYQY